MVNAVNPLGVNPTAAWQLVTRSALVMASWLSLMETYDDNSITVGYTRWIACAHEYWFHVQSEGNRTTHTIFTLMGNECAHLVKVRRERCLRWSANQIDTRWLLVDKLNAFVPTYHRHFQQSPHQMREKSFEREGFLQQPCISTDWFILFENYLTQAVANGNRIILFKRILVEMCWKERKIREFQFQNTRMHRIMV